MTNLRFYTTEGKDLISDSLDLYKVNVFVFEEMLEVFV